MTDILKLIKTPLIYILSFFAVFKEILTSECSFFDFD